MGNRSTSFGLCAFLFGMEPLVSDEGYVFSPYRESRFWPWLLGLWVPHHLKKTWGIEKVRFVGTERLQASIAAGAWDHVDAESLSSL